LQSTRTQILKDGYMM